MIPAFRHTATRFDTGVDAVVAGEANMAKVLASDLAFDACDQAIQTLGADAWDEREGLLEVYLDARLYRSGPVGNELALNFIAKHMLGLPAHTYASYLGLQSNCAGNNRGWVERTSRPHQRDIGIC